MELKTKMYKTLQGNQKVTSFGKGPKPQVPFATCAKVQSIYSYFVHLAACFTAKIHISQQRQYYSKLFHRKISHKLETRLRNAESHLTSFYL